MAPSHFNGENFLHPLENQVDLPFDGRREIANSLQRFLIKDLKNQKTQYLKALRKNVTALKEAIIKRNEECVKNATREVVKKMECQENELIFMTGNLTKAKVTEYLNKVNCCDSSLQNIGPIKSDGAEAVKKESRRKFSEIGKLRVPEMSIAAPLKNFLSGKECHVFNRITFKMLPKFAVGRSGSNSGEFCRPWGVCTDYLDRILVADRTNNRIQIFGENGDFLSEFGSRGSRPGEFNCPSGVAVDNFGRIIVADKDNHRIQVFTTNGAFLRTFGKSGSGPGEFNYPWDVAVNEFNQIAVSDSKNGRIQLFTPEGKLLKTFGTKPKDCIDGAGWKVLDMPKGLAFRPDGKLLVADFNKHEIILLDENFEEVKRYGCKGDRPGEFLRPQGIAVNENGTFAVSDCKNHRIQVFNPEGQVLEIFGRQGNEVGLFECPQGLAYHPNGNLIVVDFGNNRIQIF